MRAIRLARGGRVRGGGGGQFCKAKLKKKVHFSLPYSLKKIKRRRK